MATPRYPAMVSVVDGWSEKKLETRALHSEYLGSPSYGWCLPTDGAVLDGVGEPAVSQGAVRSDQHRAPGFFSISSMA